MIQLPNWKQNRFGHLGLVFGAYLGFGICDLGLLTLCPLLYALCSFWRMVLAAKRPERLVPTIP
jgi:hypothetical protein